MKTGIFRAGQRYLAKADFANFSSFSAGEVLVFQREGYDRYDEAQVFEFVDSAGNKKSWALFDRHPVDWREYFQPL